MTKDEVATIIIDTVKDVSSRDVLSVTLATNVHDIMDSLDHATLVIELNDKFPDARLVQNEKFFRAATISDIVDIVHEGLNV